MSEESVAEKIREVMSEIFRIPLEDIDDHISQESCNKWDSLAHLNFVMALEEEFDIHFPTDFVTEMTDLDSVKNKLMALIGGG